MALRSRSALDLGLDRLVADARLAAADLEALVVAELGLGADADLDREAQRLALAGQLGQVEVGLADRDDRSAPSIAAVYQPAIDSRTASSSTASRPTRWMITGGGTLPVRKPGTRRLRPSARAAWATRFSTSAAGTSASTRTRDSGSSVTVVVTVGGHGAALTIPWRPMRTRFATWLVCGPLGHLAAGLADWALLLTRWQLAERQARRREIKPR